LNVFAIIVGGQGLRLEATVSLPRGSGHCCKPHFALASILPLLNPRITVFCSRSTLMSSLQATAISPVLFRASWFEHELLESKGWMRSAGRCSAL